MQKSGIIEIKGTGKPSDWSICTSGTENRTNDVVNRSDRQRVCKSKVLGCRPVTTTLLSDGMNWLIGTATMLSLTPRCCPSCKTAVPFTRLWLRAWIWARWSCHECNAQLRFSLSRRIFLGFLIGSTGVAIVAASRLLQLSPTTVLERISVAFCVFAIWMSFWFLLERIDLVKEDHRGGNSRRG